MKINIQGGEPTRLWSEEDGEWLSIVEDLGASLRNCIKYIQMQHKLKKKLKHLHSSSLAPY